jgi:hypothetical protein
MENKKNLIVYDNLSGILKGWKLIFFKVDFSPFTEPAFATVIPDENSEVHGTLTLLSKEEVINLDKQEQGYNISKLKILTYDNKTIEAVI